MVKWTQALTQGSRSIIGAVMRRLREPDEQTKPIFADSRAMTGDEIDCVVQSSDEPVRT